MQVTINGEARQFAHSLTVAELVTQLGVDTRQAAVEINREIVPKSAYGSRAVAERDEIEIVGFIGGG